MLLLAMENKGLYFLFFSRANDIVGIVKIVGIVRHWLVMHGSMLSCYMYWFSELVQFKC